MLAVLGSPPRMRGKEISGLLDLLVKGITPAYAGKSFLLRSSAHHIWDHPRVCGEKVHGDEQAMAKLGSPPRMRGKVTTRIGIAGTERITPAYAGKSRPGGQQAGGGEDHPRVCGEKRINVTVSAATPGSPPRMRGKGRWVCRSGCRPWITPAYAGKSIASGYGFRKRSDHPRVCGEKLRVRRYDIIGGGSPPRMRGKVQLFCTNWAERGITPAYAGKSTPSHTGRCAPRDHPRVCGEKTKKIP